MDCEVHKVRLVSGQPLPAENGLAAALVVVERVKLVAQEGVLYHQFVALMKEGGQGGVEDAE
jgi:hypothetical protein